MLGKTESQAKDVKVFFKSLYDLHKDSIYRYALMHLKDTARAEDAVQEIFSRVWKVYPQLDPDKNMKSYLYTVSRNIVYDELRKNKVKIHYENHSREHIYEFDNSNEEHILFKDLELCYQRAIASLPQQRKKIFLMSKMDHLSNQEIADTLGISPNTVRDQLVKANKSVRSYILQHFELSLSVLIFLKIL